MRAFVNKRSISFFFLCFFSSFLNATPQTFKLLPKIELQDFQLIQTPFYEFFCFQFSNENQSFNWHKEVRIEAPSSSASYALSIPTFKITSPTHCQAFFNASPQMIANYTQNHQNFFIYLSHQFKQIKWITSLRSVSQPTRYTLYQASLEPISQTPHLLILKLIFYVHFTDHLFFEEIKHTHQMKLPPFLKSAPSSPLITHDEPSAQISIIHQKKQFVQKVEILQKVSIPQADANQSSPLSNPMTLDIDLPILHFTESIQVQYTQPMQQSPIQQSPIQQSPKQTSHSSQTVLKTQTKQAYITPSLRENLQTFQLFVKQNLYLLIIFILLVFGLLTRSYQPLNPQKTKSKNIQHQILFRQNQGITSNYIEVQDPPDHHLKTLKLELFCAVSLKAIRHANLQIDPISIDIDFPIELQKEDLKNRFACIENPIQLTIHCPHYQSQTIDLEPWQASHLRIYLNPYQAVISIQYQALFQKLNVIHRKQQLPIFKFKKQSIAILRQNLENSILPISIQKTLSDSLENLLFDDHHHISKNQFDLISKALEEAFEAIKGIDQC